MRNLLNRPISRFGMPYHGLVTDGILSTPGGDISVTHYANVEGAIAFQLRNPPTQTPNATQLAMDATHGWDWKDYTLLCGPYRNIGGTENQLNDLSWLYADENDVAWIIEINGAYVTYGSDLHWDMEVWRKAPVGRFLFSRAQPSTPDELLATFSQKIDPIDDPGGGTNTPLQIALNMRMNSAGVVPDINGKKVFITFMNNRRTWAPETVSYWNLAFYAVWGRTTINLSGSGDIEAGGVGISCSFSDTAIYPDILTGDDEITPSYNDDIDPWPIQHITDYPLSQSEQCPAPTGPGTCYYVCDPDYTHEGTDFLQGSAVNSALSAEVFRYHGAGSSEVVCTQDFYTQETYSGSLTLAGDGTYLYQTLTAVEDPPGTWTWDTVTTSQLCSKWKEGDDTYVVNANVGVDINGNTDWVEVTKTTDTWAASILSVGTSVCGCNHWQATDNFPSPSSTTVDTYDINQPYTVTAADGLDLGQFCRLIMFPGIIGYVAAFGVPNGTTTQTQITHSGKLWGIGMDGSLTLITTWSDVVEVDLTIRFPWTSVAWEPGTKEFNVQTDGVTLVKYI